MRIIRHWKTRTRLEARYRNGRVIITNEAGNVMFNGTRKLLNICIERGWYEWDTD